MAQSIKNLPIGSKIKFGKYQVESETPQPIIWKIADKNHADYPDNSTTLITEKIIDLRAFDAIEPSYPDADRNIYGNSRYAYSNIRQWLNKSGHPWFVPTHTYDEPPTDVNTNNYDTGYEDNKGFLSNFTSEELIAILPTTLTVAKSKVRDGGGYEEVVDKVFLLSATEVGLTDANSLVEGSKLALFTNNASRTGSMTQQSFTNTLSTEKPASVVSAWSYWLRTPYYTNSYAVRQVGTAGVLGYDHAYYGAGGVRPALNVKSDIIVSDTVDSDGCYVVNHSPTLSGSDNDLGKKTTSFTIDYTVSDIDLTDVLTVTEKINTRTIRTISDVVRNKVYSMSINISDLGIGRHTATITATDDKVTTTRTYTFSIEPIPYILTLDKPITINTDEFLEGKNLIVKVNGIELPVTNADDERIIYKGITNGIVDLEISSKSNQILDKIAYVVS